MRHKYERKPNANNDLVTKCQSCDVATDKFNKQMCNEQWWMEDHKAIAISLQSIAIWGSGLIAIAFIPLIISFGNSQDSTPYLLSQAKSLVKQLLTVIILFSLSILFALASFLATWEQNNCCCPGWFEWRSAFSGVVLFFSGLFILFSLGIMIGMFGTLYDCVNQFNST